MRETSITRKTKETDISLTLNIDGSGRCEISTGIGFFDHMLTALAFHAGFDLNLQVQGDLLVDCHHTIEDTGIVLGQAIGKILDDKAGIARYGSFYLPMDESLAFCSLDISGRSYTVFNATFQNQSCGDYDLCMTKEFFRAVADQAGITLHINLLYGENDHHKAEAIYKAVGNALRLAVAPREDGRLLSTKGILA